MKKINVITLCSGYGAQEMALKRLKQDYPDVFDFDVLAWAEIEPNAIKAYQAVHPEFADRNIGDITTADWSKIKGDVDLLFYSTPCQSVSNAGKRAGMKEGSDAASALIWHTKRAIEHFKPKFLCLENVKGMVDSGNIKDFNKWQETLAELGYSNYTKILNARDFCVPQNRERVFMVSILDSDRMFHFPKKMKLEKRLKDVLEENVDEKYYLKEEQVKRIVDHCDRKVAEGCGFKTSFTDGGGYSNSITANYGQRETDPYIKERETE